MESERTLVDIDEVHHENERPRGTLDSALLHPTVSTNWKTASQAVRFTDELEEGQRKAAKRYFNSGGVEPVPVQITARNQLRRPIRVRSHQDALGLHLDIQSRYDPELALVPALAAMWRFYRNHWLKLAALIIAIATMTIAVIAALMGVV